jgi:SAM-dependent methyltransferase
LKYHRLRLRDWISFSRGVEESAWLAVEDPRPFAAAAMTTVAYQLVLLRVRPMRRNAGVGGPGNGVTNAPVDHQRRINMHFDASAQHWKDLYDRHTLEGVIHRSRRSLAFQWIQDLALPSHSRVLEVGCGAGLVAIDLARRDYSVSCIDASEEMVALAVREAREAGVAERLVIDVGDAHALSFESDVFDLVIALGVVPFLHAPERGVAEMARVSRRGGWVLFSFDNRFRLNRLLDPRFFPFPGRERLKHLLTDIGAKRSAEVPTNLSSYKAMNVMLERVGLQVERCVTVGFGPFTFLGKRLFAGPRAIRLDTWLQRQAETRVPLLRSVRAQYVILARKT